MGCFADQGILWAKFAAAAFFSLAMFFLAIERWLKIRQRRRKAPSPDYSPSEVDSCSGCPHRRAFSAAVQPPVPVSCSVCGYKMRLPKPADSESHWRCICPSCGKTLRLNCDKVS